MTHSPELAKYFGDSMLLPADDYVRVMREAGSLALNLYHKGWYSSDSSLGLSDVACESFADVAPLVRVVNAQRRFAIKVGKAHSEGRTDKEIEDDFMRLCSLTVSVAKMVGDGLITFKGMAGVNDAFDDLDCLRFSLKHDLASKIVVKGAGNA